MDIDWVREYCLSLPHTTEKIQWGADLVFKIGGKMYAVVVLEPAPVAMTFKCTPEEFAELTERPGVIPAPYVARYHWVALETGDALPRDEIKRLISQSYALVLANLPKRVQAQLAALVSRTRAAKRTRRPTVRSRRKPRRNPGR